MVLWWYFKELSQEWRWEKEMMQMVLIFCMALLRTMDKNPSESTPIVLRNSWVCCSSWKSKDMSEKNWFLKRAFLFLTYPMRKQSWWNISVVKPQHSWIFLLPSTMEYVLVFIYFLPWKNIYFNFNVSIVKH